MTTDVSDDDIRAWIERHDLGGCGTLTDMRAAFEDAQSFTAERAEASPGPRGEPDIALLASMATCLHHGFGLLDAAQQEPMLADMRKLWDEVMGYGYYRPSHRERHLSMVESVATGAPARITVTLGRELFRFDSCEQWANKARSWFMHSGVPSAQVVCIDASGRICSLGKHFMSARDRGAFPVIAYNVNTEFFDAVSSDHGGIR